MIGIGAKLLGGARTVMASAPLLLKGIIVLLGIIGGLVFTLSIVKAERDAALQQVGSTGQQIAQCRLDNQTQTDHIRTLGLELQQLTDAIAIDAEALQQARLNAERLARERDRAARAEAEARAAIYRQNADCEAWGLALVCADIAERLHDRRSGLILRWEGQIP